MISSACVGIGIIGLEGNQAARASDYSIGKFKYLKRLILVHGRESYRKNSYVVIFNFYKNIIFLIPQFILGFYSYFSGQPLYDPITYQFYNLVFTSAPIVIYAIFDKDTKYELLETDSTLYSNGINSFNFSSFLIWKIQLSGFIQGILIYFIVFFSVDGNSNGQLLDLNTKGAMSFFICVLVANLRVLFVSGEMSFFSLLINLLSIISYIGGLYFMTFSNQYDMSGAISILSSCHAIWLVFVLATFFCLLLDLVLAKSYWFIRTKKNVST